MNPEPPPDLSAEAAQALFQLARMYGRPTRQVLGESDGRAVELSRILVVQAVGALDGRAATVGAVARQLDVDPSTASRLVAETVREGYLVRAPGQSDARRAVLALTPAGQQLAGAALRYQRSVFERATQDWPAPEREAFARQFVAFARAVAAQREDPTPAWFGPRSPIL